MTIDKLSKIFDKIAEWSLYILIFVLPFSKSIVEITIVTGIISLAARKVILKESFISKSYVDILLYTFLAVSLLSFFNTQYFSLSLRAFFAKSLKFALLFLITKDIINTRKKFNNLLVMALLSCAVVLIDAFIQYFITHIDLLHNYPVYNYASLSLGSKAKIFPTASFPFQNDFAAWILVFIFPMATFAFWGKSGWKKSVICGSLFAVLTYFLILTKVRGAWLGFLSAMVVLSLIKLKKTGIILIMAFILGALLINKTLISDIFSTTSISDRSVMWKNGMKIFKEHPISGNGINTFFVKYKEIREDEWKGKKGSYAHNCYLQMAADIGVLGLLAFLLFATAVIFEALRTLKTIREPAYYSIILGISLGLIAFLVHSAGDTNLYSLNLAALFWVSAGFLIASTKIARPNL